MSPRAAARLAAVGLLAAAAGCEPPCPKKLVTLETLVREHNTNADALPRLWARAKLAVTLVHPDGWRFTWGSTADRALPNGLLLLAKGEDKLGPHDFVLIGRETLAVELFRLGSSTEEGKYYFWYRFGQRGGAWFGRHEFAGAPGVKHMPIDPTQLLSVLAVCALPADATKLPAVALSMQKDPCDYAYVVTYLDRQPVTGRILFRREVHFRWSDTEPRRAYKVNLFDAAGRRVVTARMGDYRPVDVSDLDDPPAVAPVMPTDIEIVCNPFPGVEVFVERIHVVLSEMTAADIWERAACRLSSALPPGVRAVQVDAHLEPAPARRGSGEDGP
jgi:hypothetical protein